MSDGAMPVLLILLSALGLIPFVACGLLALGHDVEASQRMLGALIGYSAVVLAFAGGVHWGLQLRASESNSAGRAQLGLAVVPMVVGWIALVLPLVVLPWVSLLVLIVYAMVSRLAH